MLVETICTKSVITVDSEIESRGAALLMVKHGIHSLVVVSDNQPVGVITKSDLVKRVIHQETVEPEKKPVVEFMTTSLLTISEDATVMDACRTMVEYGVRHLLVIKKQMNFKISRLATINKFNQDTDTQIMPPMVGIISIVDILKNIPKLTMS